MILRSGKLLMMRSRNSWCSGQNRWGVARILLAEQVVVAHADDPGVVARRSARPLCAIECDCAVHLHAVLDVGVLRWWQSSRIPEQLEILRIELLDASLDRIAGIVG